MPTILRRPAAQRERDRLEVRRLRAGELFAAGVRQAVSIWHRRWQTARQADDGRPAAGGR